MLHTTSIFIYIFLFDKINAVPPEACFANFRWDDCGRPPQRVLYYWKPGSRCEVGIWRGCRPNLNMFHDEYECVNTCIFTARAQPEDYHKVNEGMEFLGHTGNDITTTDSIIEQKDKNETITEAKVEETSMTDVVETNETTTVETNTIKSKGNESTMVETNGTIAKDIETTTIKEKINESTMVETNGTIVKETETATIKAEGNESTMVETNVTIQKDIGTPTVTEKLP